MKKLFTLSLTTLMVWLAFSALALAAPPQPEVDPTLPVIVQYRQRADAPSIRDRHLGVGWKAHSARLSVTGLHVKPGFNLAAFLAKIKADPNVVSAEPNYIRRALYTPNDTYYTVQYGPQIIDMPDAWNLCKGSASVTVAVIDTGIDGSHSEFSGHILAGIDDATYPTGTPATGAQHDGVGHGTHCAGTIAATDNNANGIAGIGLFSLMPIKVFPDNENTTDLNVATAIRDAADNGAKVITMSLGGPGASSILQSAVNYAWADGCVIVAAAGNDGADEVFYPADATNVLAVAATSSNDSTASFSNYGPSIFVAAPGDTIFSTLPDNTYGNMSGTSMAAPFVAGVAALCFAYDPSATNVQVIAAIKAGADKVGTATYDSTGRNDNYGYGRLNAYKALLALKPAPVAPAVITPVNDTDSHWTYTGTWTYGANRAYGDYQKDVHYTRNNGDSATFTFSGSGIDFITETNSDEGNVDVYIDGTLIETAACESATRSAQQVLVHITSLGEGSHKIQLFKRSGTYMLVDALNVYS